MDLTQYTTRLPLSQLEQNHGQIEGLPRNPRTWTQAEINRIAASLKETPELLEARPLIVLPHQGKYVILGGNLRYEGSKKNRAKDVPCFIVSEGTPLDKLKEIVIKDNGSFGAWDYDALANEWDNGRLPDWGVPVWDPEMIAASGNGSEESEETEEEMIERNTPAPVYDAVAKYVEEQYGISRAKFVRPFYPGGDYQKENYPKDCAVVDNPPFSLLAEIVRFYLQRGIRFFLFAPTLTLFSSSSSSSSNCTAIPTALAVIYENGASVNTSFLTNMDPPHIRLRSAPKLYAMVEEGIKEFTKTIKKNLPKYYYPPHIILAPWVGTLSRLGIEFSVPVAESESIAGLDAQKESGKAIYGKGYIVSDRVMAEREKAEREKAERWTLSDREIEIIKRLNKQGKRVD